LMIGVVISFFFFSWQTLKSRIQNSSTQIDGSKYPNITETYRSGGHSAIE
jgi:hypothetical protein